MKRQQIIHENHHQAEFYDQALNSSIEDQRYLWFSDKAKHVSKTTESIYEDDEKLCWSRITMMLRWGSHGLYQKQQDKLGLTFNKKTKKVLVWFRKRPQDLDLRKFYQHMNLDWVNDMSPDLLDMVTQTMLAKIIAGKITNPKDLVKAYLKMSHRQLEVSPGLLFKFFNGRGDSNHPEGVQYAFQGFPLPWIISVLYCAKSADEALTQWMNGNAGFGMIQDMLKEAQQLGRKIDFTWSETRMKEEHTNWSQELMIREIDFIGDHVVEHKDVEKLNVPENWELISAQRRLYEEGFMQKHCVYNSYWNKVKRKEYFVFHIAEDRITVGVRRYGGFIAEGNEKKPKWVLCQAYGYRNNSCSQDLRMEIEEILTRSENQEFFENNMKSDADDAEDIDQISVRLDDMAIANDREELPF